MSTSNSIAQPPVSTGQAAFLIRVLAILVALAIFAYGVLSIHSGITYYQGADNPEVLAKTLSLREASEKGTLSETPVEIAKYSSAYVALLGVVSSPLHAFAKGGMSEHALVFSTMSKSNGAVLAAHILFGSFCLLFGALQFSSSFRQRHPKWHRGLGATYLFTVQTSMILAVIYLIRTPVANVIDQLFFATGLWSLAITVTISLWMAVYSLSEKQIAQHQAWMCLNYGLLLSTPMQRFGWLAFGAAQPDSRFMESNYAVSGALVPFAVMCSYIMFVVMRRFQPMRSDVAFEKIKQTFKTHAQFGRMVALSLMPVFVLVAYLTIDHYVFGQGVSTAMNAVETIPRGVIQNHNSVVSSSLLTRAVFVAATLLGLVFAAQFLWSAFVQGGGESRSNIKGAWGLVVTGLSLGAALLAWGIQLGMPSYATLAGGALNVLGGVLTIMFSAALAYALICHQTGWVKEWGVFVITCLCATSNFYLTLPVVSMLGFDQQFVTTGHLFRLAESAQWFLFVFPFVYAIYGHATQERLAR